MWRKIAYTFFVLCVRLHRVEKIPSVQSLVATSSRPNICGAVMALGFIRISLCGAPHSVIAFIKTWIHLVLPAPLGPRVIMPWRTACVSYSWISFRIHGEWNMRPNSATWWVKILLNIIIIYIVPESTKNKLHKIAEIIYIFVKKTAQNGRAD